MAIRLTLKNGERVEADSPEELFAYHQLFLGGSKAKIRPLAKPTGEPADHDEPLPETAKRLVRLLAAFPEGMNSGDVAKALGVPAQGVGGYVTSLAAWGKRHGFPSKTELVTRTRRPNADGHFMRRLKLAEGFAKIIKEGKVAIS